MPDSLITHAAAANPIFTPYRREAEGLSYYVAGLPSYPRNFSRDTIVAGIIAMDEDLLASQLEVSSRHQGRRNDPVTGEEPGKIHHEYPGVIHSPGGKLQTTYNACDTTPWYLMGIEALAQLAPERAECFITEHRTSLEGAVAYIKHHCGDGIFREFPPPGAKEFALAVTYWKDSISLWAAAGEEAGYPRAYGLAHFQAARGLLSAGRLLADSELVKLAGILQAEGIRHFITPAGFVEIETSANRLYQVVSDELHSLAYLPPELVDELPLAAIAKRAKLLETKAGYDCTSRALDRLLGDTYHGAVVWPFEQALIDYGARKFGLTDEAKVARRVVPFIAEGNERLATEPTVHLLGNARQLWSTAAGYYFHRPDITLAGRAWL